MKYMIYNE
jgi:hypothetical protein